MQFRSACCHVSRYSWRNVANIMVEFMVQRLCISLWQPVWTISWCNVAELLSKCIMTKQNDKSHKHVAWHKKKCDMRCLLSHRFNCNKSVKKTIRKQQWKKIFLHWFIFKYETNQLNFYEKSAWVCHIRYCLLCLYQQKNSAVFYFTYSATHIFYIFLENVVQQRIDRSTSFTSPCWHFI